MGPDDPSAGLRKLKNDLKLIWWTLIAGASKRGTVLGVHSNSRGLTSKPAIG